MNFLLTYFLVAVVFFVYLLTQTWKWLGDPCYHPLMLFFVLIVCVGLSAAGAMFWPFVFVVSILKGIKR